MIYKHLSFALLTLFLFSCNLSKPKIAATQPAIPLPQDVSIETDPKIEKMRNSAVFLSDGLHKSTGFAFARVNGKTYILGCYHGIHKNAVMFVIERKHLGGVDLGIRAHLGTVIAISPERDLAVLQVETPMDYVTIAPLKRQRLPAIGKTVYAVGFPNGSPIFVSRGSVAGYRYSSDDILGVSISCPINQGHSGGPIFAEDGEVIGNVLVGFENNFSQAAGIASIEMVDWLQKMNLGFLLK
jgi:S1-C subfamily serine protease